MSPSDASKHSYAHSVAEYEILCCGCRYPAGAAMPLSDVIKHTFGTVARDVFLVFVMQASIWHRHNTF